MMAKLSVDQTLSKANSYVKKGKIEEAYKLYHYVLQVFPKNGRAKKGLAALQQHQAPITAQNPPRELLVRLLGHYQNGQFSDAEKLAVSITQAFPMNQFSWKVLGALLGATGRNSEAADANKTAVALSPQDAEAHLNLGNTLQELGQFDASVASYQRVIALKPDYAEAHYNLGSTLQRMGRLEEAVASYTQAVALKPENALAHNNMGNTLAALGRLEDALASYAQAIALKPDYALAHNNLGNMLTALGKLDEAENSYSQSIVLNPDFAEAQNNLGSTLQKQGRLEESEAHFRRAIALNPDFAEAQYNLGSTLQRIGRLDEAKTSYKEAIALKPSYAKAHRMLASIKKFDVMDDQYALMHQLYLNEDISDEQRCEINFGLAKACEDLGNFERAFDHYGEGNALRKKLLKYDINVDVDLFKKIRTNNQNIVKNCLAADSFHNNLMPIFIVGMPRSGTTLVEQIISSHSQVTGAGELDFVNQFGADIATGATATNYESLLDFRQRYLNKLHIVSDGKLIVTDKMPQNFRYLGLIAAAFPEAKIVHVKRKPAALCWANYKQYFVSKTLGYCYAIDDVISYYALYKNLMDFWTNTLSDRIYDLDYEQLTVNQKSETRKLIDYLGLDWDEKCLSPQNNIRGVATASNVQVRKKVYKGSSEQWEKYIPFLNGAFDLLVSPRLGNQDTI